jgi:hypothetical protein
MPCLTALLVPQTLDRVRRGEIESLLCAQYGVVGADFSSKSQHLLLVGYDPQDTDSNRLCAVLHHAGVSVKRISCL